jgi:nicotinamide-nucleotide amidase
VSEAFDQAALEALAAKVGALVLANGEKLATAESCTGGWVAQCLTAIAGSSDWFERGFVTYSNEAKMELRGVLPETLAAHGAVSEATAAAMAEGALAKSRAQRAVAITGIAGPSGGTPEKPVGMVCFGWAGSAGVEVETRHFRGDRAAIRAQSVACALAGLLARAARQTA